MLEFAAFLSIFDSKFRVFVFWCCWRCHFGLCEVLMSFCFCFFNIFLAVYRPNSQIIMKIIGRLFDNEFRPCVQITLSCSNVNIHWLQHFLVFCVFASGCFLDGQNKQFEGVCLDSPLVALQPVCWQLGQKEDCIPITDCFFKIWLYPHKDFCTA